MKYLNLKKVVAGLAVFFVFAGMLCAQGTKKDSVPDNPQVENIERDGERQREDYPPELRRGRPGRAHPDAGLNPEAKVLPDRNGETEDEPPALDGEKRPPRKKPAKKMRADRDAKQEQPESEGFDGRRSREQVLSEEEEAPDKSDEVNKTGDKKPGRKGRRPLPKMPPEPPIVEK